MIETPAFIHIPRTGGNSLLRILNDKPVVIVHHACKEDLSCLSERWAFAFLRDPIDRAMSAYAYLKSGGLSDEDVEDARVYVQPFADFREFVFDGLRQAARSQRHFRPQCYWITDAQGKVVTRFLGRTERLQADFDFVCAVNGWTKATVEVLNKSNRSGLCCDEDMRAIIEEVYAEDYRLLDGSMGCLDRYKD